MGAHTFLKLISQNVITQMQFELAYFEDAVQLVSHYITGTPPNWQV